MFINLDLSVIFKAKLVCQHYVVQAKQKNIVQRWMILDENVYSSAYRFAIKG